MAGRIADADIDRVRAASDLERIAGERMALKRVGRRVVGLCPFHDEKTPSFSINPEQGVYYCFGCGASGNVFQFVMHLDDLGFVEAVEMLARRSGIMLTYLDESASDRRQRERRPRLGAAMQAAVDFYAGALFSSPEAAPARRYLTSRGYGREIAARFRLGFAPSGWDECVKSLKRGGFLEEEIVESGVATRSARGGAIDMLRGRLVFPIFDPQGAAVAVAGRRLDEIDDSGPKYLNSPDSPLYHKSRTLYGLHWAKESVVARHTAVVVEGYTDVIGFHLAGAENAIATCGTALGEDHLRLLKRYADRVVLAFDGDTAGAAATERTFGTASDLGLDVRVAVLPDGQDPADLAATGEDAVEKVLADPRPLLEFKVDRELARASLDSVEGESRALEAAAAAISSHPDATVRTAATRRLVRSLRDVTEDQALRLVESHRGGRSRPLPAQSGESRPMSRTDEHALVGLVRMPGEFLARVPEADADWFAAGDARRLAELLLPAAHASVARAAGGGVAALDLEAVGLPEDLVALGRRVTVTDPPGFEDSEAQARDAAEALERAWVRRRIEQLQNELRSAEAAGSLGSVRALDSELVAFIERRQTLGER